MPFSDVDIDLFMGVLAGAMLGVLNEIGVVEVFADVNANAVAVVVNDLEFSMSTPLEEFSR